MTGRASLIGGAAAAAVLSLAGCPGRRPVLARVNAPEIFEQRSGVAADLRAVVAVDGQTGWASGTGGTWLRTIDAGSTWISGTVPGAQLLDFRSLAAFDARRAIVLSAGSPARMFRTGDGGGSWSEVYRNDAPGIFFDALRFADEARGYALADPIAGHFVILESADSGATWHDLPGPQAMPGEGAFAASNSSLAVRGDHLWFGTGGAVARVFRSADRGRTWTATDALAPSGAPSRGVFSLAFVSDRQGALVGGDYQGPDAPGALAITQDGGTTWTAGPAPPGYRSSVVFLDPERLVTTGTSGTDSARAGDDWRPVGPGMNALSAWGATGWAVGPKGRVARFVARQTGGP
ncbi:MAG: WD40/YVTN/BNR-like repeat-containing protein [Myxococcales bacterium]